MQTANLTAKQSKLISETLLCFLRIELTFGAQQWELLSSIDNSLTYKESSSPGKRDFPLTTGYFRFHHQLQLSTYTGYL